MDCSVVCWSTQNTIYEIAKRLYLPILCLIGCNRWAILLMKMPLFCEESLKISETQISNLESFNEIRIGPASHGLQLRWLQMFIIYTVIYGHIPHSLISDFNIKNNVGYLSLLSRILIFNCFCQTEFYSLCIEIHEWMNECMKMSESIATEKSPSFGYERRLFCT